MAQQDRGIRETATRQRAGRRRKLREHCWGRASAVVVFAFAFWTCVSVPPARAQDELPLPEDGKWASTAVALLQHGHSRCDGVVERLVTYWRGLSGRGDSLSASLDHYVLTRASGDLAGGRAALDMARELLQRAGGEIDSAQGAVLDRLYEAETALCNTVAQPVAPLADFELQIEEVRTRIDGIEAELGRLLALPKNQELVHQVTRYLKGIEGAVSDAETRVRQELEALEPPPPAPPTDQELMEAWYRSYEQAVTPVKTALRDYLEGRRKSDAGAIQTACKSVLEHVIPLLNSDTFEAPDPTVETALVLVYRNMRRVANECTAGRFDGADEAYAKFRGHLQRAAEALAPYSLTP